MGFAIFDVETRVDKRLLKQVFYAGEELTEEEAHAKYREEQMRGDFPPTALHIPISIAVGNVGDDFALKSVESLAENDYSEEKLVREFWSRAEKFTGAMVSFNGRRFDVPVLELAALRYGIAAPVHYADGGGGRYRYSEERHLDLLDFVTNYGAFNVRGGLDLLLKLIGMPGKGDVKGSMVQELYEQGRLADIHRYCRNDVVQTYFLFLRVELIRGNLTESAYLAARLASAHFLDDI
jgi:predicted PolB exonuclease-like 3'-5' exonuclease